MAEVVVLYWRTNKENYSMIEMKQEISEMSIEELYDEENRDKRKWQIKV